MASCDDDFGLLGDDAHLDPPHPPHPPQPPHQPSFYVPQKPLPPPASCFADDAASHFAPPAHDDNPGRKSSRHHPKRRGAAEDFSYGGDCCSYINSITGGQGSKKGRGMPAAADYRKDREDWSEGAIGSLLDAYTERFEQLNRGNLRGRDWEDVAAAVSGQLPHNAGGRKSVEQCKNKIDNLKKRYKVECQRAACGSVAVCHWPWFNKMEHIVGNSASSSTPKPLPPDDDKPRHQQQQNNGRRYPPSGAGNLSVVVAGSRMTPLLNPRWKRVLLKIGGTTLAGAGPHNVDPMVIMLVAREVQVASRHGVEVAVAVGGRNAFCGETWSATTGTDRAATYPIGMMASLMNAVLLQASLEKIGVETRVQTALMMQEVAEPYTRRRAIRHLEKGRVVIFGGIGSVIGNPLLTTDTAAALRASEINADVILKGTAGDNLYGCPRRNSNTPFEHISFRELAARGFSMMDMTTITFCEENNISVVVFNMLEPGNISRALCGDQLGTLIDQSGRIS